MPGKQSSKRIKLASSKPAKQVQRRPNGQVQSPANKASSKSLKLQVQSPTKHVQRQPNGQVQNPSSRLRKKATVELTRQKISFYRVWSRECAWWFEFSRGLELAGLAVFGHASLAGFELAGLLGF
jgi:hypothetical protein